MTKNTWNWHEFTTKISLEKAVQAVIDPKPMFAEFESDLLSDLFAELHYWHSARGNRPTKFMKKVGKYGRAGYDFWIYVPEYGWDNASWRKCIYGFSLDAKIQNLLREACRFDTEIYRRYHPICERCGKAESIDVDHAAPEFKDLVKEAMQLITKEEITEWQARKDSDERWELSIPRWHPAMWHIFKVHAKAQVQLVAVCKQCHYENARERRVA